MNGRGVKTAKRGRVQDLREQHPEKLANEPSSSQAQRGQQEAGQQHPAHRKPRQDPAHEQEHQDFQDHAHGPEHADHSTAVAQALQVQGQEGVVRPVAELHQAHAGIKCQYPRAAQLLDEAPPRQPAARRWLGVGQSTGC